LTLYSASVIFSPLDKPWPSLRSGDPAKVYKRFGPRLNLKKKLLRHFAHPSLNFTGAKVKSVDFRHQSPLTHWFWTRATYRKSKLPP